MKKSFKISTLLFSFSLVTPTLLNSCVLPQESSQASKLKVNYQESNDLFNNNKNVKKLLDLYFENNESLMNDYLFKQNFLLDKKMQQLNYYSIYYNLMMSNELFDGNGVKNRSDANEFFKNTLSSDWFWYLKNVDKLDFQYNIFNKGIKKMPNDKETTEEDLKVFGNLTQSLDTNNIQNIYRVKTRNNRGDVFVKDVYYLEYANGWYIRLYHLFTTDSNSLEKKNAFFVWPDIYKIQFPKNTLNKQGFFQRFESKLNQLKLEAIQDDVEYNRDSESFNEDRIYESFNDQNTILNNPFKGDYYDLLQAAIQSVNSSTEKIKMWRFTLRGNHEN